MKKLFALFAAILLTQNLWSQDASLDAAQESWILKDTVFEPAGGTKASALKRKINAAPGKRFKSRKDLDAFIVDIKQRLINERLFESVEIDVEESGTENGSGEATLKLKTVDSGHFLFIPYPK
ncbi:MAG: hypothetical protein IJR40_05885 [Treponema sp.]|nr:hypothetical protein [Treponema sp.]